eukprot:CAMPEP_0201478608 /NCGR_PEP_ID=MMETSP0151_2-20130828/3396_1 /ASSEMBLY_ACC=CAM_ASM_000257 /TAXON_ID=200890 /ORGANISM="Paramoeba atlantica, Strain 621/1 / CCAP 1560/9" /LENGTH=619 /DNA_ID=CAMNT_0047859725 /DNA_START=129 /DNA_END=1988 /DNA_ORIENTATION=-
MDKVDSVILTTLRGLGCPVEEEAKSVEELSPKVILLSVSMCLNTLDSSLQYPTETVPRQMASAVSLATKLCESIKSFGYRGQIGYHQLLYASPVENRKMLSWLITQLPSTESEEEVLGGKVSSLDYLRQISFLLKEESQKYWRVALTMKYGLGVGLSQLHETPLSSTYLEWPGCGTAPRSLFGVIENFIREDAKLITGQPRQESHICSSIIETNCAMATFTADREAEWNSVGLESGLNPFDFRRKKEEKIRVAMKTSFGASASTVSSFKVRHNLHGSSMARKEIIKTRGDTASSRFRHQMQFSKETDKKRNPEEIEKEKEEERQGELAREDEKIANRQQRVDVVLKQVSDMKTNLLQMEPALQKEKETAEKLKQQMVNLRKTNELLPEAASNILKLKEISQKNTANLIDLAVEWEKFRGPLVAQIRGKQDEVEDKKRETVRQTREIRAMRKEMNQIQGEVDQQAEVVEKMNETFNSYKTDLTRELFTSTIDEIVRQVKKQQIEIDKILKDTRSLKKDRNSTSATLSRSFAITSDLLFQDAKKGDKDAKAAFKVLAGLHRTYEKLSTIVEETGSSANQIMILQSKLQTLEKRAKTMDLEGLVADLESVRADNKKLTTSEE